MPVLEERKKRDKDVRHLYNKLSAKYSKWKSDEVAKEVAKRFYISTRTVEAILKGEGIYSN